MKPITGLLDNGYDDIVTFGRVLSETIFAGSDDPVEALLDYFEAPHKWEAEYQKWREFGGALEDDCLRAFEDWYDNKAIDDEPHYPSVQCSYLGCERMTTRDPIYDDLCSRHIRAENE